MTISAMRNNLQQKKINKNQNVSPKIKIAPKAKTINEKQNKVATKKSPPIRNVRMTNIKHHSKSNIHNCFSAPKSTTDAQTSKQTLNPLNSQMPDAIMDYHTVRIFVLKYFLDHKRDLNDESTIQVLDKTVHKILKQLNQ